MKSAMQAIKTTLGRFFSLGCSEAAAHISRASARLESVPASKAGRQSGKVMDGMDNHPIHYILTSFSSINPCQKFIAHPAPKSVSIFHEIAIFSSVKSLVDSLHTPRSFGAAHGIPKSAAEPHGCWFCAVPTKCRHGKPQISRKPAPVLVFGLSTKLN
ncbi:hypothetical protein NB640_04255 [Oxalobacter vibrioformis]|uniref:Uncharacterized protein n=1 Tax=Oxalobacter vibrioformis TaxID=933080 RepID=A0A9E9LW65_9BURK|nr:hypothetical protein [Oxalobacter vibrioformis]WAW10865.1 hypothetical protein NB640_04255 [Oxalobacter vibrioformis]